MDGRLASLASRMDTLYEFDREPVSLDKLQTGGKFAGLFAGEHVAATEFVIGAFFVKANEGGKIISALYRGLAVAGALALVAIIILGVVLNIRRRK